jgi:ribosome biogenesis protein ERB1
VKLVRAIRNGWLKTKDQKPKEPPAYLLWADDNLADTSKTATGLSYIPAAKPKLPGHAESYNPPKEYLPTEVGMYEKCT